MAWPTITIPNQPALAGRSFYDQALLLDPTANALGAVTTASFRWVIGDNALKPGTIVANWSPGGGSAASGDIYPSTVMSVRFN